MKRTDFAAELARRRANAALSLADLAARAHVHRGYLHRLERGERWPSSTVVRAVDAALAADGALLATWEAADRVPCVLANDGQPTELLELAARAGASDVGATTLELVERSVEGLARSYTRVHLMSCCAMCAPVPARSVRCWTAGPPLPSAAVCSPRPVG